MLCPGGAIMLISLCLSLESFLPATIVMNNVFEKWKCGSLEGIKIIVLPGYTCSILNC